MSTDPIAFNPDDLNGTADKFESLASDLEEAHTKHIGEVRDAAQADAASFTHQDASAPLYDDLKEQVKAACDHIDQSMLAIIGNLRNDAKFLRAVSEAHSSTEDRSKMNFDKFSVPDAPVRA